MLYITRRLSYLEVLLVTIAVITASYLFTSSAYSLYDLEIERNGRGYVTDEVWYVSSSRVLLHRVLGIKPRQVDLHGVTVFLAEKPVDVAYLVDRARLLNVTIRVDYSKLKAVYLRGPSENVTELVNSIRDRYRVVDVIYGWMFPDHMDINNYLNLEHPPLGKYLIALTMMSLGDMPFYWRIPVIISGVLTTIVIYLTLRELTGNSIISLLGSLGFSFDSMSRAIFSIAILDGYVALFTSISLYLAIRRYYKLSLLMALIGGLFKSTSLFAVIPSIYLIARRSAIQRNRNPAIFLEDFVMLLAMSIVLYIAMLTITSLPLIYHMGYVNWFRNSVIGSITWHLTTKCTGQECPVSSFPLDWFIGHNSFPLYVYPDGSVLSAEGLYPLWFTSLILLVVFTPVIRERREYGYILIYFLAILGGYILIWFLGNRSQYSFYAIQLTPLIYVNITYISYIVLKYSELSNKTLITWRNIVVRLIDMVIG